MKPSTSVARPKAIAKPTSPNDYGKQNVSLKFQIEVRDKSGALLKPVQEGKIETTVTQEDKDWKPKLRDTIVVPPLADTGEYVVLIKLSDELAKASVEKTAVFHIKGRDVAPSDTLVVRNFRFLRGEDDEKPLPVAAYRPGDPVWARFDMTGYKLGDKNQVDIDYGITVLREDGSVAYTAAGRRDSEDPDVLSAALSAGRAQLESRERPAARKIHHRSHCSDNVGKQMYETRETFSVE